jgi:hypothetical protein
MTPEEKVGLRDAVLGVIDQYVADPERFQLDLRDLDLRIKLKGDRWGGVVDRPIAKFLLDLDKRLHSEMERVGLPLPKSDHGVVALRIEEGSMEAFLEYAKGYMQQFNKMNTRSQILLLIALLGALGIWMSPEIIEKLNAPKLATNASEERVELVKAVAALADNQREIQAPMRGLVNSMAPDDKLVLPGSAEEVTKKEVKASVLVKATRSKSYQYYIDFPFVVQELSTRKPGEWEIGLAFGETTFRAKMMVTEDEVSSILAAFQEAHAKGSEISPDLQVTAEINDKGVRAATVIGVGPKRKSAISLGEAVSKEVARAKARDSSEEEESNEEEE